MLGGEEGLRSPPADGDPGILVTTCWGLRTCESFLGLRDWVLNFQSTPPVSSSDSSAFSWSPRLSAGPSDLGSVVPIYRQGQGANLPWITQLEAKPDLWVPSQ